RPGRRGSPARRAGWSGPMVRRIGGSARPRTSARGGCRPSSGGSQLAEGSAVDGPFGAGDLAGPRGEQVGDDAGHLLGGAGAAGGQGALLSDEPVHRLLGWEAEVRAQLLGEPAGGVEQLGPGGAGRDDVGPDALRAELGRQRLGDRQQGGLGGGVVGDRRVGQPGGLAGHVHHRAAARAQRGQCGAGSAARAVRTAPNRFSSKARRQSASPMPANPGCTVVAPALFTRPSIRPYRSSAAAAIRSAAPSSSRSAVTARPPSPAEVTRAASRAVPTTAAPSAVSSRATAAPIPEDAPVTMTTLSLSPRSMTTPR